MSENLKLLNFRTLTALNNAGKSSPLFKAHVEYQHEKHQGTHVFELQKIVVVYHFLIQISISKTGTTEESLKKPTSP